MTGITSTGLGSGLDIKSLVAGLVSAERTPATKRLDTEEARITARVSSYGNLKSVMSTFQGSLSALKNLGAFQKLTATSSDTSIIAATAFSNADQGSYNLEVKQLAKSQTLATSAFSSAIATVGTGTLTIKLGATSYDPLTDSYTGFTPDGGKGTLTLAVDSSNNTLAGLSEAINKAKAGVTAVVVSDTSGSRLVLSSTDSGANNSMEISVVDGDADNTDAAGLSALAFNSFATQMTQHQAAQDAKLAINGLDILSPSNTVNTALKGLSLTLQQAQPGKIITVGVSQNNDDITKAVDSFVKGFNDLVATVKPLVSYDTAKQQAGMLQGDFTVNSSMARLRSELVNTVSGLSGSAKSMSDLGISTQKDGTLVLDSAKLSAQLASNRAGVAAVFAVSGRPSSANVVYASSTSDTKAGQYAVDITKIALQGVLNGAAPSSLTVAAGGDTFAVKVDGVQSGTIALTQKTYASHADLATEMQSRINGDSAIKAGGVSVAVGYDAGNNRLTLTSKTHGASSLVEMTANSTTTLGLSVGQGVAGQDVGGTIGGVAATGKGRELTATTGDSAGLKLIISDNSIGSKGTVDFSRGAIERLNKVMSGLLDKGGSLGSRTDAFQKNLDNITKERAKLTDRMTLLETSLYNRFNKMDALVGQMQSISSYLTQQFAPKTTSY